MPKSRRPKPLYQRGEFFLPPAAAGRKLEIYWYDPSRGRERRISTGTTDIEAAKRELDRRFVEKHGGIPCCPTCGRPLDQSGEPAAWSLMLAGFGLIGATIRQHPRESLSRARFRFGHRAVRAM